MNEHPWKQQAACIDWFEPWHTLLEWKMPYAKWYLGGKLNACYNALDRQNPHLTALLWENEQGNCQSWTYGELLQKVATFAHALKSIGIKKGDVVALYLPMIPQAIVSMLACARIGAVHNVVFAGFSTPALRERLIDSSAKLLITADGTYRGGRVIPLKAATDEIEIEKVVISHAGLNLNLSANEHSYEKLMSKAGSSSAEVMDSEDELFYLYTSGTTGKPKGIIHTTGGYIASATQTCRTVFDLKEKDLFWCTADIGWITGHTYVVYGPLCCGATILIYEGAIQQDTCWHLIEKYGVGLDCFFIQY